MEMRRKTKKIISVGAIIWMLTAMFATSTIESTASSTYTLSTSGSITDATVYIDGTKQAKSTITINAQVLKNGNNYNGEVNYWEVSIWRINENERPIPSGFQKTVKVDTENSSISHQREIFTPVSFLGGQNQKTQRFGFSVRAYLMVEDEEDLSVGPTPEDLLSIPVGGGYTFLGEVTTAQLFGTEQNITNHFNPAGIARNLNTNYLKFENTNGTILFVAKTPVKHSISWDSINGGSNSQDPTRTDSGVYGAMKRTINGDTYKIRLLTGGNANPASSAGGEWNHLLVELVNAGVGYTDATFITHYSHSNGEFCWTQEQHSSGSSYRVGRGGSGVSDFAYDYSGHEYDYDGWRPALELVP
jgi:hypothetical protein